MPKIWPHCTRCYSRCTRHHRRSTWIRQSSCPSRNFPRTGEERSSSSEEKEKSSILEGQPTAGPSESPIRGKDQLNRTICGAAPRSPNQKSSKLSTSTAHNSKFPMQSVVENGIDRRGRARRLRRAQSRLCSDSWF